MDAEQPVLFVERQQYNLNKLWLIYLMVGFPLLGIILYTSLEQMYRQGSLSNMPDTDMAFFIINGGILILLLIIPLFINSLVLTIQVFPDNLKIKLGPWLRRSVNLREVLKAEVVELNADELLKEYGQRKPSWQLKSQNTYNVVGKQAVRLTLLNGSRIFIGSQRAEELQQILCKQAGSLVST